MSILENAVNQAIADFDEIQATAEIPDGVPTSEYAEHQAQKEQEAYDTGYNAGKIAQDNEFWKEYQTGVSTNYCEALFAGTHWTEKTFKPKYDIRPTTTAEYMFYFNNVQDIDTAIKNAGIIFDLSLCKSINCICQNYRGKIVPPISTLGISTGTNLFAYSSSLTTIKKLILKADGSQTFTGWFTNTTSLENIEIEGVIGRNFDVKSSPLTYESAISIISHLKNYKGTSDEYKYTVTFSSTTISYLDTYNSTWRDDLSSIGWNC